MVDTAATPDKKIPKIPGKEIRELREKYGDPLYPKPRYSIRECLVLLDETRKTFYKKVKSGRYSITPDGGRSYMTHAQLLDAAEGDR